MSLILITVAAIASAPTQASTRHLQSPSRQVPTPRLAAPSDPSFDFAGRRAGTERSLLALRALLREAERRAPHSSLQMSGSSAGAVFSRQADWDAIAYCESHDQWDINAGTYWGGLQFSHSTWFAFGGGPFDGVGERVLASEGPGAWPVCFRWA
jgi:hypothetical protein